MDWKKIAPWNWFKDEEKVPVRTSRTAASGVPARVQPGNDPLALFRSDIERVFEETFSRALAGFPALAGYSDLIPAAALQPAVDISEGEKEYTIRAELPGVDRDDVSIEVEGQTLVIRAEKKQEQTEEKEGYHWVERAYGVMQRVLSLPDDADAEKIEASFKNGVLKLQIPKHAARASNARSIEIQEG
ncbi:MAG TPA: Hsp20/alpha crystallin family protein [Deltaproteobacteria bacterium]|nr:Hsp20/alpha crystallin family protein [Deltaproteobacteria bacterium]